MIKLAADIQQHRINDTRRGQRKPHIYYLSVFKAIESIPGSVLGDEYKMSGLTPPDNLYTEHEIDDFRHKALATPLFGEHFAMTRFYLGWLLRDLQAKEDEEGRGLALMLSRMIGGIGFTKQGWLT